MTEYKTVRIDTPMDPGEDPICVLANSFLRWIGATDKQKAYKILERFRESSEIVCKAVPHMRKELTVLETHMFLGSVEQAKALWPEIEFELLERWTDSDGETIWLRDDDAADEIPRDKRTKPMTKSEALNFTGWPSHAQSERQARDWLTQSIKDGEYRWEKIRNKKGVYHLDDFPEECWPEIRKTG